VQAPQFHLNVAAQNIAWVSRPNRSLTPSGRALWLYLIGTNAAVIAAIALMVGAWPVIPFAGLEVALVAIAFWVIGRHDKDYETLDVNRDEFSWRRQHGQSVQEVKGNSVWVQFVMRRTRGQRHLFLRYRGQEVCVGCDLAEDLRMTLAKTVRARVED
jgi:uncharacterized membrane protein